MSTEELIPFPLEELEQRIQKIKYEMVKDRLDALIDISPDNVYYLLPSFLQKMLSSAFGLRLAS